MNPTNLKQLALGMVVLSMVLGACSSPPLTTHPIESIATESSTAPTPSATDSPILAPTVAFTATPTPHPMSIQTLRDGDYPGSDIVIVNELDRGANYRRFYAYYLSEGLKIYALLTVPDGNPPEGGFPAIVFNHGYIPPDVYKTTERYIAYVDQIARSGYIVFRIDYRGHDNSEGTPSGAYSDPGYAVDVLNAVASIKRHPLANPDKIGMWGHSMGGYLTLRSMVVSPDIKAGVIWAGVVGSYPDLINHWRRNNSTFTPPPTSSVSRGWRSGWIDLYGSPEENPEFWNSVSSNSYLTDLSGPIQLHHGTADTSVPFILSELLWQQITIVNGEVELYKYEGDNHNISNYFGLAMSRTIEFYDRYLKQSDQ
jgi:dipeptidyl aminopeptidase/acylaminoacyl peptidase